MTATVPRSAQGRHLLGYLADHIDTLLEEWYPGLVGRVADGNHANTTCLVTVYALCPDCPPGQGSAPGTFQLSTLVDESETRMSIECAVHHGWVEIIDLAPDILLGDLPKELLLRYEELNFDPNKAEEIGEGSFAKVYRMSLGNKEVAVKVFADQGKDSSSKVGGC